MCNSGDGDTVDGVIDDSITAYNIAADFIRIGCVIAGNIRVDGVTAGRYTAYSS